MPEINVENDLTSVNDQIGKLVDELNKVNQAREQLIQQVQNLNGVAMYLRGKMQPQEENPSVPMRTETNETEDETLDRTMEYPEETTS